MRITFHSFITSIRLVLGWLLLRLVSSGLSRNLIRLCWAWLGVLAYGHDWYSKTTGGKCSGKFAYSAHYEKGEVMDFTIQKDYDSYSVPSFSLSLDMISSGPSNTFNSVQISEEVFND